MKKIRILLVEDHTVVRAGLRLLIDSRTDMQVIGEADSGEEALKLVEELQPEVVIMDLSLPGISGLEATRRIMQLYPDIKVLALTMYDNEAFQTEMADAGGAGYILKRAADTELLDAIRQVEAEPAFITSTLMPEYHSRPIYRDISGPLSPREAEVLHYLAAGYTNQEIADQLVISPKTVETHRARIMEKLDLHSRSELVRYAIRTGLLTVSDG